jgi:hypothetical protein
VKELKRKFTALFIAAVMMFTQVPFFGGLAMVSADTMPQLTVTYHLEVGPNEQVRLPLRMINGVFTPPVDRNIGSAVFEGSDRSNNMIEVHPAVWDSLPSGFSTLNGELVIGPLGVTGPVNVQGNGVASVIARAVPGHTFGVGDTGGPQVSGAPDTAGSGRFFNVAYSAPGFGNFTGSQFTIRYLVHVTVVAAPDGQDALVTINEGSNNTTTTETDVSANPAVHVATATIALPLNASVCQDVGIIELAGFNTNPTNFIILASTASLNNTGLIQTGGPLLGGQLAGNASTHILNQFTRAPLSIQGGNRIVKHTNASWGDIGNFTVVAFHTAPDGLTIRSIAAVHVQLATQNFAAFGSGLRVTTFTDDRATAIGAPAVASLTLTYGTQLQDLVGIVYRNDIIRATPNNTHSFWTVTTPGIISLYGVGADGSNAFRPAPVPVPPTASPHRLSQRVTVVPSTIGHTRIEVRTAVGLLRTVDITVVGPGEQVPLFTLIDIPSEARVGEVLTLQAEGGLGPYRFGFAVGTPPNATWVNTSAIATYGRATAATIPVATLVGLQVGFVDIFWEDANGDFAGPHRINIRPALLDIACPIIVRPGATAAIIATGGTTLTYGISPEGIATVVNGVVTGVTPGRAVLTATSADGQVATCVVIVPYPFAILPPLELTVGIGQEHVINATGGAPFYTVQLDGPAGIATINVPDRNIPSAVLTGLSEGTVRVRFLDQLGDPAGWVIVNVDGPGNGTPGTPGNGTPGTPPVIPQAYTAIRITIPRIVHLNMNDRINVLVAPLDVVATEEVHFSITGGTAAADIGLRNGLITNVTAGGTLTIRASSANDPTVYHEVTFTLILN